MLEISHVTASDPRELLSKSVGMHDVNSGLVDITNDTFNGLVDFLDLLDSSLFWNVWFDGPDGVSPATTADKVVLKSALHLAISIRSLSISTEGVGHPALTTILVTNVLEVLLLSFSKAVSSLGWLVVVEQFRKISLSSISEATNVFGLVSLSVGLE